MSKEIQIFITIKLVESDGKELVESDFASDEERTAWERQMLFFPTNDCYSSDSVIKLSGVNKN